MTQSSCTPTPPPQPKGQALYDLARQIIPGATQLFGKRQEMYAPGQWPAYFTEAKGCEVVDLDGNRYIEMGAAGIGATILGYADPDVSRAVVERISRGTMTNMNPPEEVELAQLMIQFHPWAQMVRFGRVGGESMAIAVRIARARTRRDKIAICGYHGWHDWYLAANLPATGSDSALQDRLGAGHLLPGLEPAGVPKGLAGTTLTFSYNRIEELEAIVRGHGGELAAIVMEPIRQFEPEPGFLPRVRELADECGARLIFDEISIGWRLCLGGAHLKYGIEPDLAVFAKSTGNGHPISAVIGKADTMQAAQDTFISSAFWTEAVGPTAALATLKKMMKIDVPGHVEQIGTRVREGLEALGADHGVPFKFTGVPALTYYSFDHPKALALQTLWTVRMLGQGFLVSAAFYPMLTHEQEHVDAFLSACDPVFKEMGQAIKEDDIEKRIGGPVKHGGFARLT